MLALTLLVACNIKEDVEASNQLTKLRVLGVSSDPADLFADETATLKALTYHPTNAPISYRWTWCPAPGDLESGFACALSEEELRATVSTLGLDVDIPSYDLGTSQTATYKHTLGLDDTVTICEALFARTDISDYAKLGCLNGLEPQIRLEVRAGDASVVALKQIPLVYDDKSDRNANPSPGDSLKVGEKDVQLGPEEFIEASFVYQLEADVGEEDAELFFPDKDEDGEERRETLVMTWYATDGALIGSGKGVNDDGEEDAQMGIRTSFVDGFGLERINENRWSTPYAFDSETATLFLVLRDERGGIGWRAFDYKTATR